MTPQSDVTDWKKLNTPSPHHSLTSNYENLKRPLKMQKIMKGPLQSQGFGLSVLATIHTLF